MGRQIFEIEGKLTEDPITPQGDLTRDINILFAYVQELDSRLDARVWKGTTTERLALSLTAEDEGFEAWDTTIKTKFFWSGTEWL